MADSLGALTIKFLGDIAEFRTAQQQVLDLSKQTAANVNKAFDPVQSSIKGALTGMAAVASFTFVKGQFDAFVSGAAGLKDMSERTGETVEKLSGLVAVAKVGGHSVEGLETAMLKLTKGMAGADEETKGAGHALEFLGIKSRDSEGKLKSSGDMIVEIAKKLAQFKDGPGKAAVAMDLFGKSGAQLLPMLKDLEESGDLVVKVTAEQAEQADQYEKTIRRLTAAKTALHKEIAMGVLPVAQQFADALLELKKKNDNVTDSAKKLRSEGSIENWARSGALAIATLIDGARAVPTVFKMVGSFIAGTAGELVNFGKVANAVAYILANPGNAAAVKIGFAEAKEAIGQMGKMIGEAGADFDQMAETFTKGSFRRAVEEQFALADATKGSAKAADTARKSLDDYTNATDRSKDQAKAAAAAAQALRMALVGLEQKNIQIAFDIDQDKIKSDIAALEDLFKRVGGKDLADQITALQTQATDRFAENVQTRYTALVNALNAEAKRINAMPQDGERDRALEKYVKEYEKLGPLAKELAGIEGKRNEDTRNAANRIRQQIKEMEDGYKAIWRGLDDYVNSLADAQAERALELVMIGRTKEEQDRLTIAARTEREVRALTVQLVRLQEDALGDLTDEQRAVNKAAQEAILLRIDLTKKEGEAQTAHAANRKALEDETTLWKSMADTAAGFFEDLFQNGRSAFGRLWGQAKSFFAKLAAQLLVKWVLNIDVSGGGVMGALGSILGGSGGGGGLIGNLLGGLLGGGGGLLTSLVGPGSWLGSALGMSSAIGPPAALAGTAGVTGAAGAAGGIGGVLSAIPGWGWALAGIAAIASRFLRDEKGIKIDNNLTNVGNPSSHFESSAISAFDISGDIGRETFKPFVQRVQAIDKFIADNLLTEEQLSNVRARINQLQNPRWWGFDSESSAKDAIEKASKYFLQQRYTAIFSEIDTSVAAKISGFAGTSEELFTYIGKVLDGFEVLRTLKQQLPDLSLTIDQFVELTDQQRQDLSTIAAAIRLTQQDIAAQADRVYKLQSGGIVNAFIAQGDALDDLNDKYRDGLVSVNDMASAIQSFGESAVQAMVALMQARDQIDSLVQNGIRTIEMAGLTADQRNEYLRNEAERARAAIGMETDPEKIRDLVNRIISNSTEVFNSLTPEQQAANRADFIDGLNRLRDEAQARIDKLNTLIADNASTTMAEIGASLVETVRQMGNTADKQSASVDTFASAVTDFADAAANGVRVEINLEDRTVSAVGGI